MKDLAELAIQNLNSYENFDVLGPINAFEKLAKDKIFLKLFIFSKISRFCIHVSPGSVDESPGSAEWSPERREYSQERLGLIFWDYIRTHKN